MKNNFLDAKTRLKILERKGNSAVRKLRKEKLNKGLPFMINFSDLPSTQCYLEYADGRIFLVGIQSISARDFTVIRELTSSEKNIICTRFQLSQHLMPELYIITGSNGAGKYHIGS